MSRGYCGTVSVDVDISDVLDEIDTEDLIEELDRRKKDSKKAAGVAAFTIDHDELDIAAAAYARGHVRESLIHIERALPRAFSGLAERVH